MVATGGHRRAPTTPGGHPLLASNSSWQSLLAAAMATLDSSLGTLPSGFYEKQYFLKT
jgi:hypothetical protein